LIFSLKPSTFSPPK